MLCRRCQRVTGISNLPPERRGWFTAAEVAAATGQPRRHVWYWIQHGYLTAARRPGAHTRLFITRRALRTFLDLYGKKVLPEHHGDPL